MKCPRCGLPLSTGMEPAMGGAYRSSSSAENGCPTCDLAVYGAAELAERAGTTRVALDRSPLCRLREPIDAACGSCGKDVRAQLHLSWEGIRDVIVEVCSSCECVAIARKDGERLQRMLRAAEPMHRFG